MFKGTLNFFIEISWGPNLAIFKNLNGLMILINTDDLVFYKFRNSKLTLKDNLFNS